jgi:hypothetical protein
MDKNMKRRVLNALRKAKHELETHKFAKGELAKKANGHTVCDPTSKEAACLCMEGALMRARNLTNDFFYCDSEDKVFEECSTFLNKVTISFLNPGVFYDNANTFPDYNDLPTTTKKDALARFDDAMALVKKGG